MISKTEKKLEHLENDVAVMEEKFKQFAEQLRKKKQKTEDTRNLAIVEIVRDSNYSIGELKTILLNGKPPDIPEVGNAAPVEIPEELTGEKENEIEKNQKRKETTEHEEIF